MFLRVKKQRNKDGTIREYLYMLRSVRKGNKVRHVPVANFGRYDKAKEKGTIDEMLNALSKFAARSMVLERGKNKDMGCLWSKSYGSLVVLERIWEELGLENIIGKILTERRYNKVIGEAVKALVLTRLIDAGSDLGTNRLLGKIYNPKWESIKLEHLYKALDFLMESKDRIEIELFENIKDLFNISLDLIMFDTTSVNYIGDGEKGFVEYGYNREKKKGVKQVIVGALMTANGIAIGHEVWSGNMSDVKAMEKILDKVKSRFKINRIVFVCDRGMVSNNNLEKLEELGYEYIVGVKMRQLSEEKRRQLFPDTGFEKAGRKLQVKDCKIEDRRYIVCYNPEEAEKEKINREYFIKHLEKKVEERSTKDWVVKNGYKKYIQFTEAKIEIDYAKLKKESIYDGKWVLLTNTNFSAKDIGWHYKGLWQIERNFRKLKSDIEVGPIYHWVEPRIRAHIFVCFLSLVIRNIFEKKIKNLNKDVKYSEVMNALKNIEVVNVRIKDEEILIRTELPPKAHIGFEAVKVKIPPQILECTRKNLS